MPRISKFTSDTTVEKTDKLLGSNANGSTKNFAVQDISTFFKNTNASGTAAQFGYQYKSSGSGTFTPTFSSGSTFANLNSVKVNKYTYGETDSSENILAILSGKDVIIVDIENQNNFGVYTAGTPTQDGSTDFYDIALSSVQSSNGSLTNEKFYSMIAYGGGADKAYTHTQDSGLAIWPVTHNLGKRPSVTVVDVNNIQGYGIVTHTNANELTITFPGSTTGKAYCN
jgi:hypothetical protein